MLVGLGVLLAAGCLIALRRLELGILPAGSPVLIQELTYHLTSLVTAAALVALMGVVALSQS